jgi:hypothetical protein
MDPVDEPSGFSTSSFCAAAVILKYWLEDMQYVWKQGNSARFSFWKSRLVEFFRCSWREYCRGYDL